MKIFDYYVDKSYLPLGKKDMLNEGEMLFDIETTGLSAKNSSIYLIGCCYYTGNGMQLRQYFCEDRHDEFQVLESFMKLCQSMHTLISFNGDTFDIPYLREKYNTYNIDPPFQHLESIDLYKIAKKYKHILQTENLKQKSIERALGVYREDPFSGKELIDKYHTYEQNPSQELLDELTLHNYEDVLGMLHLLTLRTLDTLSVESENIRAEVIVQNDYHNKEKAYLIVRASQDWFITNELTYRTKEYYMILNKEGLKLSVGMEGNDIPIPYEDYSNYVYLPLEDIAIPKALATGIPKNEKLKATPYNCYGKKEVDDSFLTDTATLTQYCSKIVHYLLTTKPEK